MGSPILANTTPTVLNFLARRLGYPARVNGYMF